MHVSMLEPSELEVYLSHLVVSGAESGVDGCPHSHPYGRDEPYDAEEARRREERRWSTPLDEPGWRRAWGLRLDDGRLIGHLYLEGGALRSEMHRVRLGMGVQRSHHRQGGGRALLAVAVEWARSQPDIEWIDLGVFDDNEPAQALYERFGFIVCGRTPDRFRVDGVRLGDIAMSLNVGAG